MVFVFDATVMAAKCSLPAVTPLLKNRGPSLCACVCICAVCEAYDFTAVWLANSRPFSVEYQCEVFSNPHVCCWQRTSQCLAKQDISANMFSVLRAGCHVFIATQKRNFSFF
ncbi:hypothetical protein ATANTOWER_017320 [Ataeniobius toweri]|uniref:Secreted protein n=1 Tax=Ataeniobius toweri TaxID=208326 RepID=A0ABU7A763_9TELE|nr:hypothetical protein [Ataeniobius toweri]